MSDSEEFEETEDAGEHPSVTATGDVDMQALITFMARQLVDDPDKVAVKEVEGENAAVFELSVAESDLGKVIGKSGRTARAMRTILSAASVKSGKRAVLDILE